MNAPLNSGLSTLPTTPVKVCIVISNLQMGGAERQVVQIVNGLDKNRFKVTLVSLSGDNPLRSDLDQDVSFHEVLGHGLGHLGRLFELWRLLVALRPDVVHGFLFDAEILSRLAAKLTGVRLILGSERNSDYEIPPLKKLVKSLTNPFMDLCVANSFAGASYHRSLYGLAQSRYRVVRNGVDIQRFRPRASTEKEKLREVNRIPNDVKVVGVFASMKAQKNHIMLIRAAELLKARGIHVQYLFVGGELEQGQRNTTEYTRELAGEIEASSVRNDIIFLGKRQDVEDLYPCCDLTVLPSIHEGLPNVVLESIACGIPVVATDVSDNRKLIDEFAFGEIVAINDYIALADAIERQLDTNKNICPKIEILEAAREKISRQTMIGHLSKIYAEEISPNRLISKS